MILRSLLVFFLLALLAGGLAFLKYQQIQEGMAMFSQPQPPAVVSAAKVQMSSWQPRLEAVGNVQAVQGVMVNNEVAGQIKEILFESGDQVTAGQELVRLDTEVDEADLNGLRAGLNLAQLQLDRNQKLLRDRAVSQGDFDQISAQVTQALAQVQAKQALIRKKTIRAPFTGQLGIRRVNLGQFLEAGSAIVELEALDPVYVDYALPERRLSEIAVGQPVEVRVSAYPDQVFEGKISAISPAVNQATRNIQVRALLQNPDQRLLPGMFAKISTLLPVKDQVLTLPRQAITFNTYGDSVFLIQPGEGEQEGQLVVQRRQVKTGAVRDQEVEVLEGLEAGDQVVSSGQVKLRNGSAVSIADDSDAVGPDAPAESRVPSNAEGAPDSASIAPVDDRRSQADLRDPNQGLPA
ncbi:efflux transporter periplasmic adaptor subunit [Lamprobacter modestohalophilus]|uniref:Efflux transporter periplasmic adaptor subunit n=1 Tax=Lamprobacter modestohalophilus TaxID=1064514 RepID=A0A9X0W9Z1_9GAMM|nr:efflux RND transporter periplasmic adaptor subunit [Lamprobacter modestohalophilus]MBK1619733.1 efflux transporter periplasmic adaptor subunit [Lamprobacter modestohalophilus]